MKICPTNALFRRRDGIVDLNGDSCIGCRACMVACPYDQLFIDPNTRTAEKCNFCANRVENQLQPSCVSVCPTECRIFGDLDDPESKVAEIVQREMFMVRKPEKGHRAEGLLSRRRRKRDAAGDCGAAVHVSRRRGPSSAAWRRRSGSVAAWRSPRGLRRAAQEGLGHRSGHLPADERHLDRRDVPVGRALADGRPDAARRFRRTARLVALLDRDRRRPHRRSRAAGTIPLHPDPTELDVVDGARRVSAHGARRDRGTVGLLLSGRLDDAALLDGAAGDDRRLWRDRVHRAALRAGTRTRSLAGTAFDGRSGPARRGRRAAPRCCSPLCLPAARRKRSGSWR